MIIEIGICILGIAFSIFLFIFSIQLPPGPQKGIPGPSFFPYIISTVIFFVSVIVALNAFRKNYKQPSNRSVLEFKTFLRFLFTIFILGLYSVLWIVDFGNFIVNTLIVFIPLGIMYSVKRWYISTFFVIILVSFIYLIFSYILRVPLWYF